MIDTQKIDISVLIEKFRLMVQGKSESSRLNYFKAIKCLEAFTSSYAYSTDFPSRMTLADWLLNMKVRGISTKTAIYYLDIVSALYKEAAPSSGVEPLDVFRRFKAQAKQALTLNRASIIDENAFNKILSITKSASANPDKSHIASDILLYSLLNGAIPLADVAKVKVTELEPGNDAISIIARRNSSPSRKYLFPLNQSKLTSKQLKEKVDSDVKELLAANNIPVFRTADNAIKLIWAYAALKCGIPGSEIVAMVGSSEGAHAELSLCVETDLSSERRKALTEMVGSTFSDNPLQWYAMKLRSRVKFDEVKDRIKALDGSMLRPELFYPYEEICKRMCKKIVKESQPVIRDIVFFRLRVTDIFPLFCKIGDLAWCYTTNGKPGGDYAPIPKSSFDRFQETIGHFTPEYEVAPIGGFEPKEGETVVIINGPLANYEFEIEKTKDTGNVIFQLNMIGDNGFQWRTSAEKRQIEPA